MSQKPIKIKSQSHFMTFGKYRGLSIETILDKEPGYIIWLHNNTHLSFKEKILEIARKNDQDCHFASSYAGENEDFLMGYMIPIGINEH